MQKRIMQKKITLFSQKHDRDLNAVNTIFSSVCFLVKVWVHHMKKTTEMEEQYILK